MFHSVPKRSVQPNQPNPMTFISSSRRHKAFTFIRKASRSASWSSCQVVAAWTVLSIQGSVSMGPRASQSFSQRFTATILMCKKTTRCFLHRNYKSPHTLTTATFSSLQALHPALPEHQQLGNPWGTWTFAHDMRDQTKPCQIRI